MITYDKSYVSKLAAGSGFNRDTFEKVLRLVDVLEFMNKDELLKDVLALKGGTAINLLDFDLPRLSVDIDLDYTNNSTVELMKEQRGAISQRIESYMKQQGYVEKRSGRQSFILDSYYFSYTNTRGNIDHIKFDINYVMRAHIYPVTEREINTNVFGERESVNALNCIEIYGSKINALNNRAAVRDLYDVWKLLESGLLERVQDELRKAVVFYHVLTSDKVTGDFTLKAADELTQNDIMRDLVPVLNKGEFFGLEESLKAVKDYVIGLMALTPNEEAFIGAFAAGEYKPSLLYESGDITDRINNHPMARWKCQKIKKARSDDY